MNFYEVEVEEIVRRTVFVEAEDENEAEEAAEELASGYDKNEYDTFDIYSSVRLIDAHRIPNQTSVWVGGPEGEWVASEEVNK